MGGTQAMEASPKAVQVQEDPMVPSPNQVEAVEVPVKDPVLMHEGHESGECFQRRPSSFKNVEEGLSLNEIAYQYPAAVLMSEREPGPWRRNW
jgi:hypothetical protein